MARQRQHGDPAGQAVRLGGLRRRLCTFGAPHDWGHRSNPYRAPLPQTAFAFGSGNTFNWS